MTTMNRLLCYVWLLCMLCAVVAPAQEPRPVERTPAGVEFNFQDADLRVVLTA
jgi:hypothetical protein